MPVTHAGDLLVQAVRPEHADLYYSNDDRATLHIMSILAVFNSSSEGRYTLPVSRAMFTLTAREQRCPTMAPTFTTH